MLGCLLLYFMLDAETLELEEMDDRKTIKRFVNVEIFDKNVIQKTILQAKEVLNLRPFPYEWVENTANGISCKEDEEKIYSREDLAKKWIQWMLDTLEEEARKAGKL
ncbi:hypothetical protein MIDIC_570004 [Alphaproteobacteria bacterium]